MFLYWVFHSWPFFCPMTRLWVVKEDDDTANLALNSLVLHYFMSLTFTHPKKKNSAFHCLPLKSLNMFYRGARAVLMHCLMPVHHKFPQILRRVTANLSPTLNNNKQEAVYRSYFNPHLKSYMCCVTC